MMHKRLLLLLVILATLLIGCGADVDVTVDFYRGENWQAVTELAISTEALALSGGPAEVEKHLDELVADAEARDVRASWKKTNVDGALVYTIEMKGEGLNTLSQAVFDGDAEIYVDESDGRRLVHFSQYASSGLGFNSQTITLRGGEIVSGNGRYVDDHTMIWQNPSGRIEATLTERSSFSLGSALGIAAGAIVIVGLIFGGFRWWQGRRRLPPAPCPECGFWIPEGARFCPGCGRGR